MRTRRRRFKDRALQETYDVLRANPPANLDAFRGRGSASNAYVVGFLHPDRAPTLAPPGSLAYAAWAAGVDNARSATTS